MELTEISDRIDIKLNSFQIPIEVDEYEKSIYLTRAQKLVYKDMCQAFEVNELVATYLNPFIVEFITNPTIDQVVKERMIGRTISIKVPDNIYQIIWEKAVLSSTDSNYNNKEVKVLKTRINEVEYKIDNPFRKPDNKEILRVVTGNTETDYLFELLLPENADLLQYRCKYLEEIKPIILEELPDGLTIENEIGPLNSKYTDEIVEKIIDIAVASILQDKTALNQQQNV